MLVLYQGQGKDKAEFDDDAKHLFGEVCHDRRLCRKLIHADPAERFADAAQAIDGDGDGAWHIRAELIRSNLAVKEASAMKGWIEDVKKVAP